MRRRERPTAPLRYNSDVEADVALSRCTPSGPRSLTPVVGQTTVWRWQSVAPSRVRERGHWEPALRAYDGAAIVPRLDAPAGIGLVAPTLNPVAGTVPWP
jgi:hypothetical protein